MRYSWNKERVMVKKQCSRQVAKIKTLSSSHDLTAYWKGYMHGLRLAYHVKTFESLQDHRKWLELIHDCDEVKREMGKGYRDGIKHR
jgi:hypothetical protein